MGKCYSQLTYERDITRSVHGCVESLPQADKMVCSGQGDIGESMRHYQITRFHISGTILSWQWKFEGCKSVKITQKHMFPNLTIFSIVVKTKSGPLDWPVLICCNEDMCNYMDSMDINIQVSSSTKSNGSIHKGKQNAFSLYLTCQYAVS